MAAPPLGKCAAPRERAHLTAEILHGLQVFIHGLAGVEPGLLALVLRQRGGLILANRADIDEEVRLAEAVELVAVAVRLGVVEGDGTVDSRPWV